MSGFTATALAALSLLGLDFGPPQPPKALYHFGNKAYLQQNAREGNVPQKVWDEQIMTTNGAYRLNAYRQGLYGSESPDWAEYFGANSMGSEGRYPWMMKIYLKEECRTPKAVEENLERGPGTSFWLALNFDRFVNGEGNCLALTAEHCGVSIDRKRLNPVPLHNDEEHASSCEQLLNRYLMETNKKVVRDGIWPNSWYIRDRDCVEKIEAGPEMVLRELADAKWGMDERSVEEPSSGAGASLYAILLGGLADLGDQADSTLVAKLRNKAKASDITARKSTIEGERSESLTRRWISVAVPAMLDSFERCQKNGSLAKFRESAAGFSAALESPLNLGRRGFLKVVADTTANLRAICR